jgi:hypothetical protein
MKLIFFYLIVSINGYILQYKNLRNLKTNIFLLNKKYFFEKDDNYTGISLRNNNPIKPKPIVPLIKIELVNSEENNSDSEKDIKKIIKHIHEFV